MDRRDVREVTEEEQEDSRGLLGMISSLWHRADEADDNGYVDASGGARPGYARSQASRLDPSRANAIFIRLDFRSMQDAQAAADRLKERRPVIVNFERTDEDVARRGVDFISGVTYALDGFYQKVGEKVFLFTPSNTAIAVDDEEAERYGAAAASSYAR